MKRIRICNFGRIMLKLFCVTTILLSVYLLFGFFGYYQKWFDGPEGITQQTMYWLIRLGIGILVEALIFGSVLLRFILHRNSSASAGEFLESCVGGSQSFI